MSNSHLRSNIVAEDGTQTITGMAAMQSNAMTCATLTATNLVSGSQVITGDIQVSTFVKATSYIQIGDEKYIFAGDANLEATVVAEATALVATPIKGSLYMGLGSSWIYTSDTAATKL